MVLKKKNKGIFSRKITNKVELDEQGKIVGITVISTGNGYNTKRED